MSDSNFNLNSWALGAMRAMVQRSRRVACVAFMLVIALTSTTLHAQLATAQITGSVRDPTGAVIPGAEITATQTATGVADRTTANDQGLFVFPTLPVGSYTIDVSASGFSNYSQKNLVLTIGQQLQLNIPLKIGASDQTVTVTAGTVSVDTASPTQQSTVGSKEVEDLPLNGRNPATLTYTVAGVTDSTLNIVSGSTASLTSMIKAPDSASPQESAPSVHGARPGGTYFSLDGSTNTDPLTVIGGPFPNPDATGEFNVVTGTYGARYVSAPGGAINIVSRSGTNAIHGTAFEFIRNGYVNARNALSTAPDVLKRNQFGFALGAPVLRDKLFLFGTYQATPTVNNVTKTAFVPTTAQRQGNFGTFQLPASMISPVVQKYLQFVPFGDPTTGFLSFQSSANSNDQQGLIKADLDLNNHRLFVRSFYDRSVTSDSGSTPGALALAVNPGYIQPWLSNSVGDTWTAGKWVLDSRVSYLKVWSTLTSNKNLPSLSDIGLNNITGGVQPSIGYTVVEGNFSAYGGDSAFYPRQTFEAAENVFVEKGKHQISFGANYRRVNEDETNYAGENPDAVYFGVNTYIDELYGIISLPAGTAPAVNPLADFIEGAPYVYLQQDGYFVHASGNLFGLYGEDTFRMTDRLTLTGGLRWDPFLAYDVARQRISCFQGGAQSSVFPTALPGLLFPGDHGCPKNGVPSTKGEFEPRVGFSYQLDKEARTVIRAGYGRYDLQLPFNSYVGFSTQPYVRNFEFVQPGISIDNVWGSVGMSDPFASGFHTSNYAPPKNLTFLQDLNAATFQQNFHPGYVQQWSLSVQHLLTSRDSIDIAYNGTEGTHLPITESLNTPAYIPGASSASNEKARQPYPAFGQVRELTSAATSNYNGLDVTYKHKGKNFAVSPAFSWSKALDDSSQPGTTFIIVLPNANRNLFRGRSDFDQNLVFRTTGSYTSPSLASENKVLSALAGSWTLSGLVLLDAGQPFSVTDGDDNSYTGLSLDLADRVPGVPLYQNGRLNLAAFTDNAPGTFGNSGRNAYRGRSYKDVDLALIKDFPMFERVHGTFRTEAFNVFNHPNFLPPNAAYGSAGTAAATSFGQYLNARDPRILQFSLKVSF